MRKWISISLVAALPAAVLLVACSSTRPEPAAAVKDPGAPVATSAVAYEQGVAGGAVLDTIKLQARVTAVDKQQRMVTLLKAGGDSFEIKLGPEVINFDQIAVGNMVDATVTRSVVIQVEDAGSAEGDAAGAVIAGAPKGSQPAGLLAGAVQFVGTVVAMDLQHCTVELRFADGVVETLPVRPDVDMTRYMIGQKVIFRIIGAITIEVSKP